MSTISEPGTTWYFTGDEQEPFLETPLKECTPEQIQAKLKFLIKNILLLRCECEVIELNSIKVQPDLITSNTIDISWMPFALNFEQDNLLPVTPKIPKISKDRFRQSIILSKSNKSIFGSMYNVVHNAITVNKISIHQVIAEVEKAIITLEEYFDKINVEMTKKLDEIEIETENIELEINRQLQNVETYKTNVLVAGVNKLTKRIPAEKYEKFIKKKLMSTSIYLNDIQFKIIDAINEQQMLHESFMTSKHIRNTVFEADMHNVRIMNKKLLKEQIEIKEKNKKLKHHLGVVRQDYLKKKYHLEKFELNLGLPSLNAEIKHFKNKLLRITSITQKITLEVENNDKDHDDDDDNETIYNEETEDDQINHYLEVKRSIEKTEKYIKTMKLKLDRQNKLNKPVMTLQNLYDFKMTSIWAFLIGMLTAFGFMFIFWFIIYKGISIDTIDDNKLKTQKPTTICSCLNRYCCKDKPQELKKCPAIRHKYPLFSYKRSPKFIA
ncbi:DNA repair protein RAD50-like [Melanaphis sacchari]|uniref:DNA repair protein RAD50-like n=1 Tax=Melanaphis sacchari TaxID=742174 RepID=UPI000DC12F35|nr:DNA repair protein RAD50-like [Melanaphis sacchari]